MIGFLRRLPCGVRYAFVVTAMFGVVAIRHLVLPLFSP